MAASKTTELTDKLMRAIAKDAGALDALKYLGISCANAIVGLKDETSWIDKQQALLQLKEFCEARAAQCYIDRDPDEDLL